MAGNGKNYIKMAQQARDLFLKADQESIIKAWNLDADEDYIYLEYFSQPVKIDRKTAEISAVQDFGDLQGPELSASKPGLPETFPLPDTINESMVLFDILTRKPARAEGGWASVSVLGGIIGAGHDRTLRNEPQAARFAGKCEKLRQACEVLGGTPDSKADVGYAIPVFKDFKILFQFWDADDEFPASIKYLFDTNALQFMHYETLWYVMGCCYDRIAWQMKMLGA